MDPHYRPGSKDDFDRLYQNTYRRVHGTLVTMLRDPAAAEDCAQEAYEKAFRAWRRWKPEAPAEAWVHRIAINVAVSHLRRERLRSAGEVIRRLGAPAPVDPQDIAAAGETVRALRSLPPRQAAALILRHLHGYTNREIGFALGIPERTFASRLAAAKAAMRAKLVEAGLSGSGEEMGTSGASGVSLSQ